MLSQAASKKKVKAPQREKTTLAAIQACQKLLEQIEAKKKGLSKAPKETLVGIVKRLDEANQAYPSTKKAEPIHTAILSLKTRVEAVATRLFPTSASKRTTVKEHEYQEFKEHLQNLAEAPDLGPVQAYGVSFVQEAKKIQATLTTEQRREIRPLIKTIEKKLGEVTASETQGSSRARSGSPNRSGSDCFVNAFYQFVQIKELQEHLIDQLPEELWEVFATSEPNATEMRDAITEYTGFGREAQLRGLDPRNSQMDATEVLNCVMQKLYCEDTPKSERAPIGRKRDPQTSGNPLAKRESKIFIIRLFMKLLDGIAFFFRSLFGLEGKKDTPQEEAVKTGLPKDRLEKRKHRRLLNADRTEDLESQNPLSLNIKRVTKRNIEGTFDKKYESLVKEQWGPEIAPGVRQIESNRNAEPFISLPLEKAPGKENEPYQMNDLMDAYISEVNEVDSTQLKLEGIVIASTNGGESTRKIIKDPDNLLISFKRFDYQNGLPVKINDDIHGIKATYTLPARLSASDQDIQYELGGFITHQSHGTSFGHYVAYRKEDGKWWKFDDSSGIEVSETEALNAAKKCYLTFFRKVL